MAGGRKRWIPRRIREAVLERDGNQCVYCGRSPNPQSRDPREMERLHMDHVTPESRGGKATFANLVAACWRCNKRKSNRTPAEWGR